MAPLGASELISGLIGVILYRFSYTTTNSLTNFRLALNQAWYIYCVFAYTWPRTAAMELALCVFCLTGTISGLFMVLIQLRFIYRRGTQYFPGDHKKPGSFRNIVNFFFRHSYYCRSLINQTCSTYNV